MNNRFILIIVLIIIAIPGTALFYFFSGGFTSDFRPEAQWNTKCKKIPKSYAFPFDQKQLNGPCSLTPLVYDALVEEEGDEEKVRNIFSVSGANSVGVQFSKGLDLLIFEDQYIQRRTAVRNIDQNYYDTVLHGASHTMGERSMLFTKDEILFFNPAQNSVESITQTDWIFPADRKGEGFFTGNRFVDRETDFFGRLVYERKTDSLEIGVANSNECCNERRLLLPYTPVLAAADKMFFYCHGNTVRVFNDSLNEIDHPISTLVKKIPGIDSLQIFNLYVHPTLQIAFIRIGENIETPDGIDWLWMLNWSDTRRTPAKQICERAIPHGFSPDFEWFHFSVVQTSDVRDPDEAHFVFKIDDSMFEREPILSAPIRLSLPTLNDSSKTFISDFTWVTTPMGLAVVIEDKILRWTFPE
jgi:hypothetical protein